MKDLYRALELSSQATEREIRDALNDPIKGRHPHADYARGILLNPSRRRQYDRVHQSVKHIGELRSYLELGGTRFALRHESDFVVRINAGTGQRSKDQKENNTAPNAPTGREPQAENSNSFAKFVGWSMATIAVAIGLNALIDKNDGRRSAESGTRPSSIAQETRSPDLDDQFSDLTPISSAPLEARPPDLVALPTPATGAFDTSFSDTQNAIIIRTSPGGLDTLVKIEDIGGNEVTRGFIRAGESHTFFLQRGTYIIKTASGTAWYGENAMFGPDTSYSRPDDTFPLLQWGEQWTVELIPQQGGNLRDRRISAAEF